jgi:hypothetical protein
LTGAATVLSMLVTVINVARGKSPAVKGLIFLVALIIFFMVFFMIDFVGFTANLKAHPGLPI